MCTQHADDEVVINLYVNRYGMFAKAPALPVLSNILQQRSRAETFCETYSGRGDSRDESGALISIMKQHHYYA